MEFSRLKNFWVCGIMLIFFSAGVLFTISAAPDTGNFYFSLQMQAASLATAQKNFLQATAPRPQPPPEKLANPPEIIKAVYVTGWSAGSKSYLKYLTNLFKTTEINAVVVDIKDYSGLVSYKSDAPEAKKYNLYNGAIKDIDALVRFFHDKNIYFIARISVFEDPAYSKARPDLAIYDKTKTKDKSKPVLWRGYNKLTWLDPASKEAWDYNISLARDILAHGADEVNFDYVRFPSDGKIENLGFPGRAGYFKKREVTKSFFKYARQELGDAKLSIDLFGQSTVNLDDLGIGQILEDSFEYFDYISPMVYPSHYAENFIGFKNPAEHPYEVVNYSMATALARLKKYKPGMYKVVRLRPWLQDFNMGAFYTADMVKAEINAAQDALKENYAGFMLWNPSNIYSKAY